MTGTAKPGETCHFPHKHMARNVLLTKMAQRWAEGQGDGGTTTCFNRDLQTSQWGSSYPFKLLWTFAQSAWYSRAFSSLSNKLTATLSLYGIGAGSRFFSSFLWEGPFKAMWCWGRERLQIYSVHSGVPDVLPVPHQHTLLFCGPSSDSAHSEQQPEHSWQYQH